MKKCFVLGTVFFVFVAILLTSCNNGVTNDSMEYVDLGLPSGTKWKFSNETGGQKGLYSYKKAMRAFGDKLPTKYQMQELKDYCRWEWQVNGSYKVIGPNGNHIVLPAAGERGCGLLSKVSDVGKHGSYWSSSAYDSFNDFACYLGFAPTSSYQKSPSVWVEEKYRCCRSSVRLVRD